ncbi:MAG: hypothetical protein KJ607_07875 [Bacteroidetes bacterium]|nr:hypothetical protein [Bacteroidota bacterium]
MTNKFIRYCFFTVIAFACISQAPGQKFEVESTIIGIGFGPAMKFGHNSANRPAFAAKIFFDKGIYDRYPGTFMVGADVSYFLLRHETPDSTASHGEPSYVATWTHYIAAARLIYYHNGIRWGIDNLHVFGGISLGVRYVAFYQKYYGLPIYSLAQPRDDGIKLHYTFFAGASYHLTPEFAAYFEGGYSESWITIGFIYSLGIKRMTPKFK